MSSSDPSDKISISRDDLAAKAGTAKETLIRTLSELKSEGLISIENGLISVLDKEATRFYAPMSDSRLH